MKNYKFKINGQTFSVEVGDFEGNNAVINVNGSPYNVELLTEPAVAPSKKTPVLARKPVVTKPGEGEIKKTGAAGSFKVQSPLPGSIFKMLVKEGDTIKEGDCLLIMEAMKMENNILCEKAGVVTSVKVKVGDSVLQGDTLIEIG